MKRRPTAPAALRPHLLGPGLPLALATLALAGCSTISETITGNKVDYRANAAAAPAIEVPPDLTQLQADPRYQRKPGTVVSATGFDSAPGRTAATAAPTSTVALDKVEGLRVLRSGDTRWLLTSQTPEQLWPQLRRFWDQAGFKIVFDRPELGVMETDWAEDRTKLPMDPIRRTIGKVFDAIYDTGLRDRYRTRIERSPAGTEIYITHRGTQEVLEGARAESTRWVARPSDPGLEAEMLAQLMVALGSGGEERPRGSAAAAAKANADAQVAQAAPGPTRARVLDGQPAPTLQLDDDLDRAWRRVSLALDRSAFTIEDRDRNQASFYVRYVDPNLAGQEEPGPFARLFGARRNDLSGVRYVVKLQPEGATRTRAAILDADGKAPADAASARNIAQLLLNELR